MLGLWRTGIEAADVMRLLIREDRVGQRGVGLCGHGILWHRGEVCGDHVGALRI